MTPDDLLNMLHEQGLDDDAIKELLSEALAGLEPEPEPEADEKAKAEEMLGVEL